MRRSFIKRFKKIYVLALALLVVILFAYCGDSHRGLNEKLNFVPTEYQTELRNNFISTDSTSTGTLDLFYKDTLKYIYAGKDFIPWFITDFEKQSFVDSLLSILYKADENGLNPARYHASQIKTEYLKSIGDSTDHPDKYKNLANTELLVCDAVLRYSNDIKYGVINPKVIFGERYNLPIPDSSKKDLLEPLNRSNLIQYLNDIQPRSKKYKQLQAAFKHFKTFKNIEWHKIPVPAKKIILGDRDSTLRQINERLITLGFIDTSNVKINDYAVYDSLLENEIKEFQEAYGLVVDGVISKNTIEKLNITPNEYLNKIKVSLERFRWIDYSDTAKYILVNIPDFKLYAIENGNEKFDIKICTGRKRYASYEKQYLYYKHTRRWQNKPEDWETPSMYGQISYLVLNPTWTVPPSIMREEISAKIRKDSTYLQTANFKVFKNGTEIDPSEVALQDFSKANIPYNIVQGPGAGNALGKIKFIFSNPFGIYLHDTPTRAPFGYQNRAVSHGCMRVEKPLQLAEYILQNNSKWNIDYLKLETGIKINNNSVTQEFWKKRNELRRNSSYGKTTEVKLYKKIPLFVDYYTAWVDGTGIVNFRDDVYDLDKIVLEHLSGK